MIHTLKYLKYSLFLPILFIQFSCDTATGPTVYNNGDVVGSWMLTGLTGAYVYTVNLPDGDESGMTWPAAADTSFGIHMVGEHAAVLGDFAVYANYIASEVVEGDILPGVTTESELNSTLLEATGIGLIGVFEDAPSAGSYATYKIKGVYPLISYDYSQCTSASSAATMTDQGVYTWDQTATTLAIKRDPNIGGSQVLPPFNDGTLTVTDDILNIQFLDRDSHSSLYAQIPDQIWDEGTHPSLSTGGINSGGDRTYMAFPDSLCVATLLDGYGATFVGACDGTNGTPSIGPAYLYDAQLAYWGNYMTWNAWSFLAEMEYLVAIQAIADDNENGSPADELITYMLTMIATDAATGTELAKTHGIGYSYALLVTSDGTAEGTYPTDDSARDFGEGNTDGKLQYTITSNDCAVPADVTIDFNATFTRCTTDNCTGDSYHVEPSWD